MARPLAVAWRLFTPEGRTVAALAAISLWAGRSYEWSELTALGAACAVALVLGLVTALSPRRASAELSLHPAKVVVGSPVRATVDLRAGALPLLHPLVEVPLGRRTVVTRFGLVLPRRSAREDLEVPTVRRGVHQVGPVTHVAGDLLGMFRRRRVCAPSKELFVRPVTVHLPTLTPGVVVDLEGVPSDQLSSADLAFHALREYVPGDDLRHVHWRSSAKHTSSSSSLLVRQYQESRRSHAMVVLDSDQASYASRPEFELAVSAATSLALRAAYDDFDVAFACGEAYAVSGRAEHLLDASCRFDAREEYVDLPHRVLRVSDASPAASFVAVVTGSAARPAGLTHALGSFSVDISRLSMTVSVGEESGVLVNGGHRALRLGSLDDLPRLLGWLA